MNLNKFLTILLFLFLTSCQQFDKSEKSINYISNQKYSNTGFALIYDDKLKRDNKISKKIDNKYQNLQVAIITPDKDIIPDADTLNPAFIVFDNYEIILQWNRSLRFALAVCTLKNKFKNEIQ